jgi:hypothetical protein
VVVAGTSAYGETNAGGINKVELELEKQCRTNKNFLL